MVPEDFVWDEEYVSGAFSVWNRRTPEVIPFKVRNLLSRSDIRIEADYPETDFRVVTSDGQVIVEGNVATLLTSLGPQVSDHLNLEVLYAGQSFGFEGSRTATDRLRSHETLQGILAEALERSPDMDIWLVLVSFEDPYLGIEVDPTLDVATTDEEDNAHIAEVAASEVTLQQQVNLAEAMTIRYFAPIYNKVFRNSFPNPAHRSYSECYELDFVSVGIELNTDEIRSQLWSRHRQPAWTHLASFPLHDETERASILGWVG